jgi:hypothetical protein
VVWKKKKKQINKQVNLWLASIEKHFTWANVDPVDLWKLYQWCFVFLTMYLLHNVHL